MEDKIPPRKTNQSLKGWLIHPEKEDLEPSKYIDHTCHNTPGNSTSGKYVIKIPRFDSGTPEEWIIFMELVQKALVGQNITTDTNAWKGY